MPEKRLYRPADDRVIAGVCGAFADYFGLDATLVRLGWVVFVLFGGAGLVLYLLGWAIIPDERGERSPGGLALVLIFLGLPFLCSLCALCLGLFTAALGGGN